MVLTSFPRPRPTTNPYITQLARSLEADNEIGVLYFGWRAALLGRYDVVHLHWPDILVEGRTSLRRTVKRLLVGLWCVRMVVRQVPVVRTWHNLNRPAGLRHVDHVLLSWLDRLTLVRIKINDTTALPPGGRDVTILHGHYRDWFSPYDQRQPVAGRIAFVGRIRPYKGVEHLLRTFRCTPDASLSLTVAGLPADRSVERAVRDLADGDPRIDLDLRYVDDETLVAHVTESVLVVLPYRQMHNSGAALAALSLGRPVLVPDNEVNRKLAHEVGPGWVHLFADDVSAHDFARALASTRPSTSCPDLSAREWSRAARDHLAAYRQAVELASRRSEST
ncbi:glycosyltransferase [Nocardioides marmoraquaticus]